MGFQYRDKDGDTIGVSKASTATPNSHYMETGSTLGAYIPFEKTSELVASMYEDMDVRAVPTPVLASSVEQAERYAASYARAAVALRQRNRRQEVRDQLVKDFFSRTKGVGIDTLEDAHYREYEDTCRFFDTDPYDAPGAR